MFCLFFCPSPGGDGGRPNGAGNSLRPCIQGEGSAHRRAGFSRRGTSFPQRFQNGGIGGGVLSQLALIVPLSASLQLNIYTPLSGAASPQLRAGVRLFPRMSLNCFQSSVSCFLDVYYYVIDPPPDFLPRFGTITMAGLLGMFLARKGSRFKRVAVPLGLMSAGASVCYPAQAVSVLKVMLCFVAFLFVGLRRASEVFASEKRCHVIILSISVLVAEIVRHFPCSPPEGSGFKPDPTLMDFGQSSPEDEDLYSTRS
uniref:MICOS complex subunit n=1 Tax=Fundulus heteroclitus TaxID=8078 RepID=A0A3Q2QRC7_FUNHE